MTLQTNLQNLTTRIATEFKALRAVTGGLASLTTTQKTSLVAAINELDAAIDALAAGSGAINDGATSTSTTWSSTKTAASIAALINDAGTSGAATTYSIDKVLALIAQAKADVTNALTNGAGAALDTLKELSDALGGDANFATTTATALGKRLRFDAAQTLTAAEKTQGAANLGLGDPETDLVALFNTNLV